MTNLIQHRGNKGSNVPNTHRNPSPHIWANCPWDEVQSGAVAGHCHWTDFDRFKASTNVNAAEAYWANGWLLFGSDGAAVALSSDPTEGTAAIKKYAFGEVTLSSDGDNEGAGMRLAVPQFKITGPHATATSRSGKLWFEARIRTSTIADTKHGIFCGLVEDTAITATVPIAADGTLADKNFVGFHRLEGDGDQLDTVYKANGVTQVTVKTDAITLVADTYVKVGMIYDPVDHVLRFYKDGVELADTKTIPAAAGTDFPNDVVLTPIFHVLNATATTPGSSTIDWVRVAQVAL